MSKREFIDFLESHDSPDDVEVVVGWYQELIQVRKVELIRNAEFFMGRESVYGDVLIII